MVSANSKQFDRPLAARVLPEKWFYGWYIAVACALLMFVGVGVGYYGLSVFLKPLQDDHGWSSTQVSLASSIYFGVSGLTGIFVGAVVDRRGPRQVMAIGIVVSTISAVFIGFANELWQLYLVYFIFAIANGMSTGVTISAIMTRWFVRKRALAMSISSTGVSLGGVILSPIASKLIDIGGLALATSVLGVIVLIVGLPVVLFVMVGSPADMGVKPDGDTADTPAPKMTAILQRQYREWTRAEAMRTVSFWAIFVAFLAVLIAQTGYIIHQVSFLTDRFGSRTEATFTISLTAFGSIVARLVVGIFADNIDRRMLTAGLFIVQATCVLIIVHFDNLAATWILTLVFGFTIGNVYMMQSLIAGEIFGMVSFGSIFGLLSMAGQAGSALGPFAVGFLKDQSGGYTLPFTVTSVVTYCAAVVILFARPVGEKRSEAAVDEALTGGAMATGGQ